MPLVHVLSVLSEGENVYFGSPIYVFVIYVYVNLPKIFIYCSTHRYTENSTYKIDSKERDKK